MKKLTRTDVACRLAVPTHFFRGLLLPRFNGTSHFVDLKFKYKNQKMEFRCTKRKTGEYDKPVLTKGWLHFVRRERLKVGDKITLLQEEDQDARTQFTIKVQKKIRLLGKDIWTDVL
ncbi:hypothetical protein P3X46_013293 [Hevea brasiliensis]|uniref:TF-B3 domain-containing protein n=1 Tax=Hevea brasiliensis TaxID=3981 RepID=A0ABQ9M342_HEVBR|nr:hypothetical protein P3X46_013293 [Hevea brasiliensis]